MTVSWFDFHLVSDNWKQDRDVLNSILFSWLSSDYGDLSENRAYMNFPDLTSAVLAYANAYNTLDKKLKPYFPLPGEKANLGDRLILNALRRKFETLDDYNNNPTKETQKAFLEAVDHLNYIKENV